MSDRPDDGLARWARGAAAADLVPPRHPTLSSVLHPPFTLAGALPLAPHAVVAAIEDVRGQVVGLPMSCRHGQWRRAVPGDGVAAELAHRTCTGALPISAFALTRWQPGRLPAHSPERAVGVDQTHESVVVGDRVVVKWTVGPLVGPSPGVRCIEALSRAGFTELPQPWGALLWPPAQAAVGVLSAFVPDALDGWDWAVADVRSLAAGRSTTAEAVAPATAIGALVGRMHLALSERGTATAELARSWRHEAEVELDDAVALVDGEEGARLRAAEPQLRALLDGLAGAAGTPLSDTHGDLHVGQLLRSGPAHAPSYVVIDFDGNPVAAPAGPDLPAPLATDVVSLVQSLDHVGRIVVFRTPGVDADVVERWSRTARSALLASYRAVLADAGQERRFDASLVPALRARQVVREYLYAVRHLPHWRYVPDTALPSVLAGA